MKEHLVVVGNGMAGARAVEEILERGGGARFRITMFGDEPYGNYNRIMLSHVLAGDDADDRRSARLPRRGPRDQAAHEISLDAVSDLGPQVRRHRRRSR